MGILCLELSIVSILHIFAYPTKPYRYSASNDGYQLRNTLQGGTQTALVQPVPFTPDIDGPNLGDSAPRRFYKGGFLGIRALGNALNPWDFVIECYNGFKWLFGDRERQIFRGSDNTYQEILDKEQVQRTSLNHLTEI
jgi:hypothetical protein